MRRLAAPLLLLFAPSVAGADIMPNWGQQAESTSRISEEHELLLLGAGILLAVCIAVVGLLRLRRSRTAEPTAPSPSESPSEPPP